MNKRVATYRLPFILLITALLIIIIILAIRNNDCTDGELGHRAVEIPNDIEVDLRASGTDGTSKYTTIGGAQISTNEWFVNLYDIVSVFKSMADVEGFYIYPAVYNPASISIDYIIVVATSDPAKNAYYQLSKNCEIGDFKKGLINKSQAQAAFKNYYLKINSVEHVKHVTETRRPSRYYELMEFYQFVRNQGLKPLEPNIDALKNYKLYIKGAAVSDDLAKEINKYWSNEIPKEYTYEVQVGFTAFMYIIEGESTRRGQALEIGKPCPPRCGELSWQ